MNKENSEIKELINSEETNTEATKAENKKVKDTEVKDNSGLKRGVSNILDQSILLAASALLTILIDYILPLAGYRLVTESGAAFLFTLCIYFIGNCIYGIIVDKTKSKKTIAKKMLNL